MFPHSYQASATGGPDGEIPVDSPKLSRLVTTAPPEFDGPEGYWSPETMLTAAVANCFILTFRSVSRRKNLAWRELRVDVTATLDKTPEGLRFTRFDLNVDLALDDAGATDDAAELLESAKKYCLVTASLNGETVLAHNIHA